MYVQWATNPAQDWVELDTKDWLLTPKLPIPDGSETLDSTLGWIFRINIQGVVFSGYDHYAVEDRGNHVLVHAWNSDLEDYDHEDLYASSWEFYEIRDEIYADNRGFIKNRWNTNQNREIFGNSGFIQKMPKEIRSLVQRSHDDFAQIRLPDVRTRHGVWVHEQSVFNTLGSFKPNGWRDWIPE